MTVIIGAARSIPLGQDYPEAYTAVGNPGTVSEPGEVTPMSPMSRNAGINFRLTRRHWLQAGAAAFGVPSVLARSARLCAADAISPARRARGVLLIMLPGGLGQHDSFDMKPDAPDGIRGEFRPIATTVPGLEICEHLPLLAARAHRYALVRTMSHLEANHFPATHKILTGHAMPLQRPGDAENFQSRHDWPCYAGAYDALRPRNTGVPNGISLPHALIGGGVVWPGQHAGFLGAPHDPWQITRDPNEPNFREESVQLPAGVTIERLSRRGQLLQRMEAGRLELSEDTRHGAFSGYQAAAVNVLVTGRVAAAFDLDREPTEMRDRYGRHQFGQSLLLARRLIEAGVTIVQANMGPVQTWDTHENNFARLRQDLFGPLDRGVSALLDDLEGRGLLDETLVIMSGEFGRTPRISLVPGAEFAGRNHWPQVYTAFFAGAGVVGGQVIGRSDALGAFPDARSYSPDDLGTTLFNALGLAPETPLRDKLGRPFPVCGGEVIEALYASA
jgi:Protein of unknown function (DUF1501)